jgi:hypothetical protein
MIGIDFAADFVSVTRDEGTDFRSDSATVSYPSSKNGRRRADQAHSLPEHVLDLKTKAVGADDVQGAERQVRTHQQDRSSDWMNNGYETHKPSNRPPPKALHEAVPLPDCAWYRPWVIRGSATCVRIRDSRLVNDMRS